MVRRELSSSPSWAYEAIRIGVPDDSKFSFEDILELRAQLRDELLGFRQVVADMHEELLDRYDPFYIVANAQNFVDKKITPPLAELNAKVRLAKRGILKKMFDEARDPRAYAPLVGTLFGGLPLHVTTMMSLGLISVSAAWDYANQLEELKTNGLYYLIELEAKTKA